MADVPLMNNPMTTQDDLIVAGASGVPGRLAKGSDGQILTVDPTTHHLVWADNGGAADILDLPTTETDDTLVLAPDGAGGVEWRAEAGGGGGGGLVLLEQHTASGSASLDFTTCISSTYDTYEIVFVNVIPATNDVSLLMQMGTGAGPTYDTGSNYQWSGWFAVSGGGAATGASPDTSIAIVGRLYNTSTDGVTPGATGSIRLFGPQGTVGSKQITGQLAGKSTSNGGLIHSQQTVGVYNPTTALTAFRFLMASGNIASGTIRVYGLEK